MSLKTENFFIKNPQIRNLLVITTLLITFFAAWLPDFEIIIGMESGRISSMLSFGTLNGFLLGPVVAPVVTVTAMLLHLLINPNYLGNNLFTMLSPTFVALSSIIAGLCITGRQRIAASIFGFLLLSWFFTPIGVEAYPYVWFHLVVFGLFILVLKKSIYKRISKNWHVFLYLFLSALLAVLADHLAGSITAAFAFNLSAGMFRDVIFIYPIERIILAFAAAVLAYLFFLWTHILYSGNIDSERGDFLDLKEMIDYIENDVKKILPSKKK